MNQENILIKKTPVEEKEGNARGKRMPGAK